MHERPPIRGKSLAETPSKKTLHFHRWCHCAYSIFIGLQVQYHWGIWWPGIQMHSGRRDLQINFRHQSMHLYSGHVFTHYVGRGGCVHQYPSIKDGLSSSSLLSRRLWLGTIDFLFSTFLRIEIMYITAAVFSERAFCFFQRISLGGVPHTAYVFFSLLMQQRQKTWKKEDFMYVWYRGLHAEAKGRRRGSGEGAGTMSQPVWSALHMNGIEVYWMKLPFKKDLPYLVPIYLLSNKIPASCTVILRNVPHAMCYVYVSTNSLSKSSPGRSRPENFNPNLKPKFELNQDFWVLS